MNVEQLVDEYLDAKTQFTHYKALEAELRIQLLDELFKGETIDGTESTFIGEYKVKGTFKLGFKLDKKAMADAYEDLSLAEQNCIKFDPGLILSAYKALDDSERQELDDYITVSPSMPTIKIEKEGE